MGGFELQYRTLQEGCGLWKRSDGALIAVGGEDRQRLLNGLVTTNVAILAPGQGGQGFFTDVKGRVLCEAVFRPHRDHLLVEVPLAQAATIAAHIERYIVADRVEVAPPLEPEVLTLLGSASKALLRSVLALEAPPQAPWGLVEIEVDSQRWWLTADAHFGVEAFSLWPLSGAVDSLERRLQEASGSLPVDRTAVEIVRIEAGVPLFGRDYDSRNLPQESGLEAAVDYAKGCFLGQEVVARLHYRGRVTRRVTRLRGELDSPPSPGEPVLYEGREAGVLTSVAGRPGSRGVAALAMLQRRAFESGTEVELSGGEALVVV